MPDRRNATAKALSMYLDPRGACAIASRALRDTLLAAGPFRTILVSSLRTGDGRSTVAANLAIALAEPGKSVLLVDASFRAPVQHEWWSLCDSAGLGSIIGCSDMCTCAIQPSDVARLDVLPFGTAKRGLGAVICDRLQMIAAIRHDHIVIDGPALSDGPETGRLGECCDVSLLVLRRGLRIPTPSAQREFGVLNAA